MFGIDAATLGVRPNASADQSRALQHAIDHAAAARMPLLLAPRQLSRRRIAACRRGETDSACVARRRIVLTGAAARSFTGSGCDHVELGGLTLDGAGLPLPGAQRRACTSRRRAACALPIARSSMPAAMASCSRPCRGRGARQCGDGAADAAIFSNNARGLTISGNHVRGAGNNGILVWRDAPGDDGTLVDRQPHREMPRKGRRLRTERQRHQRVPRRQCDGARQPHPAAAFSAVRGNAASNLQILGNICTGLGEVALYAEFGFEGAVIANNTVDGAALGVSVTNFNEGGRLAVVQGNLIRNLVRQRPAGTDPSNAAGIGISVEADTLVTGNVVENAPFAGIMAGWGHYLRDVTITSNIVRNAEFGIGVSVAAGRRRGSDRRQSHFRRHATAASSAWNCARQSRATSAKRVPRAIRN